ncbi:hypothetical protein AAGY07_13280, partial [Staphylococcus aureus]
TLLNYHFQNSMRLIASISCLATFYSSGRRGKKQAIVTRQERFLATMVANLRSARVERCQARNGCFECLFNIQIFFG